MQKNESITSLYWDLMDLQENISFEYKDFPVNLLNGTESPSLVYRVFCVRLATYAEFKLKNALESRGIMFLVDTILNEPIDLVCRPMEKFFNYKENPYTIFNQDIISEIEYSQTKVDGSLISTYIDVQSNLRLKSKTSISSDISKDASRTLEKYPDLFLDLNILTRNYWTVNLEYTSPNNRIILEYNTDSLTVLNARHRITGEYMEYKELKKYSGIKDHLVEINPSSFSDKILQGIQNKKTFDDVLLELKTETDKEGYIIRVRNQFVKIKNDWYCKKHKAKDSINSDRNLFELIINEEIDDYIPLFSDMPCTTNRINSFINYFVPLYNAMIDKMNTFYDAHKHEDKKVYASTVMSGDFTPSEQWILFALKQNKTFSYKEQFIKQWPRLKEQAILLTSNLVDTD